ncbi:MAG: cyclic nucleotide-binding domain-containing protein [Deltaproteobacteria bacterium]|nr:cyclic nucleotide-binding domain-containing protein [Deltaproteobacteria bacterium]
MDILSKLRGISLFEGLGEHTDSLLQIKDAMEDRKISAGDFVIKEGDSGNEMYILLDGTVTVQKRTIQGDQYVVTRLSAKDGAFFGEMALVGYDVRSATVKADTDCRLVVLTKDRFEKLANENFRLGFIVVHAIARRMAEQLRRANQDMMVLFEALLSEVSGE